ncbi:unnamed protein product [Enterobius vermicularis]|uniref:Dehydrogenase/reductase SDR family member 11 n=1 Tax=Enterobius vermicularis TaxID=51028 RepID=A0A0N4VDK2_ENTVE|nr:unnamed protein product [Enterobius vermicularis]
MVIGGAENPYVTEHRRIHPLLSMNVPIYWSVNELFHVCAQDVHLLPSAGQSGVGITAVAELLAKRIAIVTASTKGVGFAIAKCLGLNGASVVISSKNKRNVEDAVKQLRSEGIYADGTVAQTEVAEDRRHLIQFAVQRYGELDVLVSTPVVKSNFTNLLSITVEEWDQMLNNNALVDLKCAVNRFLNITWGRNETVGECASAATFFVNTSFPFVV